MAAASVLPPRRRRTQQQTPQKSNASEGAGDASEVLEVDAVERRGRQTERNERRRREGGAAVRKSAVGVAFHGARAHVHRRVLAFRSNAASSLRYNDNAEDCH